MHARVFCLNFYSARKNGSIVAGLVENTRPGSRGLGVCGKHGVPHISFNYKEVNKQ